MRSLKSKRHDFILVTYNQRMPRICDCRKEVSGRAAPVHDLSFSLLIESQICVRLSLLASIVCLWPHASRLQESAREHKYSHLTLRTPPRLYTHSFKDAPSPLSRKPSYHRLRPFGCRKRNTHHQALRVMSQDVQHSRIAHHASPAPR